MYGHFGYKSCLVIEIKFNVVILMILQDSSFFFFFLGNKLEQIFEITVNGSHSIEINSMEKQKSWTQVSQYYLFFNSSKRTMFRGGSIYSMVEYTDSSLSLSL